MNLNKGYEPTPEELEKVEEQEVNKKMIAKLEVMRDKINAEMNTVSKGLNIAKVFSNVVIHSKKERKLDSKELLMQRLLICYTSSISFVWHNKAFSILYLMFFLQ